VFASDVQGPMSAVAAAYLIRERPHLLYLSGPPSYLERQLGPAAIDRGIDNLRRVIDATGARVIMDHYALRDGNAGERFRSLWDAGVVTAAATWAPRPRRSRGDATSCGRRSEGRRPGSRRPGVL